MIEIQVDDAHIPDRLKRMAKAVKEPRRPLADLGGHWQRRVKQGMPHLPPGQAANAGSPPAVHTSEYVHSITYDPSDADSAGILRLGSSSIHARMTEKGGKIVPKHAKRLAIPVSAESFGKRPRDFMGLKLTMPAGAAYLVQRGVPLFLLLRSVTLHPHPHMAITDADWDYFGGALQRELDKEWGKAT